MTDVRLGRLPARPAGGRLRLLLVALLACPALLAGPGQADPPQWGNLLLIDHGWPVDTLSGAVVVGDIDAGTVTLVTHPPTIGRLAGIAWGSRKTIYAGDATRIWVIDPYRPASERPALIRHTYFKRLEDFVRMPDGDLYLADSESDPLAEGRDGAILRLRPADRTVSVVATDPLFSAPSGVALAADGSVFVLDPQGRMAPDSLPAGAIFRVDPARHTVEPVVSLRFAVAPTAILVPDTTRLLLLDSRASLPDYPAGRGAIFALSLDGFAILDTLASDLFREPIDFALTGPGRLAVLDRAANPAGYPENSGAVFVLDLESQGVLETLTHPLFSDLGSMSLYDGPDLDGSSFTMVAQDGRTSGFHPNACVSFRGRIVNRVPSPTGPLTLTAGLGPLDCLLGTAVVESGTLTFQAADGTLEWQGELAAGDTVSLSVDVRVPGDVVPGGIVVPIVIAGAEPFFVDSLELEITPGVSPGQMLFVDAHTTLPSPRVFRLGATGYEPQEWLSDRTLLPRLIDLTFGHDGTVYLLDNRPGRPRVVAADPGDQSRWLIHEGEPFTNPTAICLAHDGSLLITDSKSLDETFIPPVIYRLDPKTGELTEFFTTTDRTMMSNPADICPDRYGHYLVADFVAAMGDARWGRIVELDGNGRYVRKYQTSGLMDDPFSVYADDDGSIFISDTVAIRPSIIRLVRQPNGQFSFNRLAAPPNDSLLVAPTGIERISSASVMICDWAGNPFYPGRGTLLRLDRGLGEEWDLTFQSLHYNLGRPRRAAVYRLPELSLVSFTNAPGTPDPLLPGDILRVIAILENRAPMPGIAAGAWLSYPPLLEPVLQGASEGVVTRAGEGRLRWAANLAFQRPETLRVSFRIDPLAGHDEPFEILLQGIGGLNPPTGAFADTVRGPLPAYQVLALDIRGDPLQTGNRGGLYLYGGEPRALTPFRSDDQLHRPSDLLMQDAHSALLLESMANPAVFGLGTGALWRWDLDRDILHLLSAGAPFVSPQRVQFLPGGDFLVLDSGASCALPAQGTIFRVPAAGGRPEVVLCSPAFRQPVDMVLDDRGRAWVADVRANPRNLSQLNVGAIFGVDLATGAVVDTLSNADIHDPQGLLWVAGRGLFFTDPRWNVGIGQGIRVYDPDTRRVTLFKATTTFRTPSRLLRSAPDEILVADSSCTPAGSPLRGAILRFGLATAELLSTTQHANLAQLHALARVPAAEVAFRCWTVEGDEQGGWRSPGDTLVCQIVAHNRTSLAEPWTTLTIDLSENLLLIDSALRSSRGQAAASSGSISWEGAFGAFDSVVIDYAAVIAPRLPGMATWTEQLARLTPTIAESDSLLKRHYISNLTQDGEILVADARANPGHYSRGRGAIFRLEGPTREPVPVVVSEDLRTPSDVALLPGSLTEMFLVDAEADPLFAGVSGCLMRASTRTGELRVVFQDSTLVDPIALAVFDSTTCYVLDAGADPFDLVPGLDYGPGAVYFVDLGTGQGVPIASDARFTEPTDLVLDPLTGRLFVIDERAPGPGGSGGAFVVDPHFGTVEPFWIGAPFLAPHCGALSRAGDLLILDRRVTGGSAYLVTGVGTPTVYASCPHAVDPRKMLIDELGRMVISDATANPGGFPTPTGSLLRIAAQGEFCQLFRGGPPFVEPRGMSVRYEVTAVALAVSMLETGAGVRLCWTPPASCAQAGFYVYRRAPEIPGSEFELLNPERPVEGSGGSLCFLDAWTQPGELYEYQLMALLADGSWQFFAPVSTRVSGSPATFFLAAPFPNPFHSATGAELLTIRFGVPAPCLAGHLAVFDASGRVVRTLMKGACPAGIHAVPWDGREDSGAPAASGLYFIRLDLDGRRAVRRAIVLR